MLQKEIYKTVNISLMLVLFFITLFFNQTPGIKGKYTGKSSKTCSTPLSSNPVEESSDADDQSYPPNGIEEEDDDDFKIETTFLSAPLRELVAFQYPVVHDDLLSDLHSEIISPPPLI